MAEKKAPPKEPVDGEDPLIFAKNYSNYCKLIGVTANKSILTSLQGPEKPKIDQVIVAGSDEEEFAQGSMRALMTGEHTHTHASYKHTSIDLL